MSRIPAVHEHPLPVAVTYSAKKSVRRAVDETLTDRLVTNALRDLWNALRESPIALVDKATGRAITFEQFASVGTKRTVKKIEKLARRVRKTTRRLSSFLDAGGSVDALQAEMAAEGNRAANRDSGRTSRKAGTKRLRPE